MPYIWSQYATIEWELLAGKKCEFLTFFTEMKLVAVQKFWGDTFKIPQNDWIFRKNTYEPKPGKH